MRRFVITLFSCIALLGITLICSVHRKNQLTHLQLEIPQQEKELKRLKEENQSLEFSYASKIAPSVLEEWLRDPRLSHLKSAEQQDIVTIGGNK